MVDTKALVEKQRAWFETRVTLPLHWRREQLQALDRAAHKYEAEIFAALKSDLSKSPEEAYLTEIGSIYGEIKAALKHVKTWMKPQRGSAPITIQPARAYQYADPLGVTLIIAPWNYPYQLSIAPLAERWDLIFFTGGTQVGRVVAEAAAKHLTPTILDLGGKSPCIIDRSADLEVTARRIAWGKYVNAGQTCIAPDYVLIPPSSRAASPTWSRRPSAASTAPTRARAETTAASSAPGTSSASPRSRPTARSPSAASVTPPAGTSLPRSSPTHPCRAR